MVDVTYPKRLQEIHSDLLLVLERIEIDKYQKRFCNMYGMKNCFAHKKILKLALDYGLILETNHKVIKFNQKAWLKPYIGMDVEFRRKDQNNIEQDLFKLISGFVFAKTMKKVRNYRDIKLVAAEKRRNKLVLESDFHTSKHFSEKLLTIFSPGKIHFYSWGLRRTAISRMMAVLTGRQRAERNVLSNKTSNLMTTKSVSKVTRRY